MKVVEMRRSTVVLAVGCRWLGWVRVTILAVSSCCCLCVCLCVWCDSDLLCRGSLCPALVVCGLSDSFARAAPPRGRG